MFMYIYIYISFSFVCVQAERLLIMYFGLNNDNEPS